MLEKGFGASLLNPAMQTGSKEGAESKGGRCGGDRAEWGGTTRRGSNSGVGSRAEWGGTARRTA